MTRSLLIAVAAALTLTSIPPGGHQDRRTGHIAITGVSAPKLHPHSGSA